MNPTAPCPPADNERRTPLWLVEMAREVMGGIDLDPASDDEANKLIQASHIYTKADGGLTKPWFGRVFLNPPGGLVHPETYEQLPPKTRVKGALSSAAAWWSLLHVYYTTGRVTESIFVAFNLEILLNAQRFQASRPPQHYPFCVPAKRVSYPSINGGKVASPQGASAIFYLGKNPTKFRQVFSKVGYTT